MKALLFVLALFPGLALADVSIPREKQYAYFDYLVSRDSGASVSREIGLSLPAGSIITNAYVYIVTQFAASGTESLGVSCVGSQDLVAYTSVKSIAPGRLLSGGISRDAFTGAAAPIPASPTVLNLAQGFASIPNNCGVTIDVRGNSGYTPYTTGELKGIIEYFRL